MGSLRESKTSDEFDSSGTRRWRSQRASDESSRTCCGTDDPNVTLFEKQASENKRRQRADNRTHRNALARSHRSPIPSKKLIANAR
jgi:hypothetical protein